MAPVATDDYRRASYEIWQEMAAGWDRDRNWMWEASRAVSENLLEALRPSPGQTILELAAGTGETGFVAARAVGPTGRVISTDFAPEMVAAARRESERLASPTSSIAKWTPNAWTWTTTASTACSAVGATC